jgi:hypothetical protein
MLNWLNRIQWVLIILLGLSILLEFAMKNKSQLLNLTLLILLPTLLISSIILNLIIRKHRQNK